MAGKARAKAPRAGTSASNAQPYRGHIETKYFWLLVALIVILVGGEFLCGSLASRFVPGPLTRALETITVDAFVPLKLEQTSVKDACIALAGSWNTYKSIHYSIFLAAIYVPAALILANRTNRLVRAWRVTDPNFDQEKYLKSKGLDLSFADSLRAVVAICAPFLAGAISGLPGYLTK